MDLGLTGRVALVAASSGGLGRAIGEALAREGAIVALNGRDPERLERTVEEVGLATHGEIRGFVADVSSPPEAEELVARVELGLGPVDVLVCNAGGPPPTSFADARADAWLGALELNLLSTIHLCRAAVPGMVERGWGRVVCVASIAAKEPQPGLILSTTARAGVLGFAKALSDEVAAHGVTVNVLCPGSIGTDRIRQLAEARGRARGRSAEEMLAETAAAIPARRIGRPDEFAAAAAFLASERASYVTGVALSVDGGAWRGIL